MNSTITFASGIQNMVKSLFYTPCSWISKLERFLPHQNNPQWEKPSQYYGEWLKKYSDSLEVIPSYEHTYYDNMKKYFKTLNDSFVFSRKYQSLPSLLIDRQTIKNFVTTVAISADLLWRQLFASTVKAFYGGQGNADAREIGLIILTNGQNNDLGCEEQIKAIIEEAKNPYKGLIVPRYRELTEVLEKLSKRNIEIVEIAGQTSIEIELIIDRKGRLPDVEGIKELYRRRCYTSDQKEVVACLMPVNKLKHIFKDYRNLIHRIYDF